MRPNTIIPARTVDDLTVNYFRAKLKWNTPNAALGVWFGTLPVGALIMPCLAKIITPFNGTTPIVTVGTDGGQANIFDAASITETAAAGVTVTSLTGQPLIFTTPTPLYMRGVFTNATQGEIVFVIPFVPE